MKKNSYKRGFTLVELIIVVAILALLAAALYVAIDPAKRIGEARDAQRWSSVASILNAILTYTVDNTTLPTDVSGLTAGTNYAISTSPGASDAGGYKCTAFGSASWGVAKAVLSRSLTPTYIATLPMDPAVIKKNTGATWVTSASSTGFYIQRTSANRIKIGACHESNYTTASIYVSR